MAWQMIVQTAVLAGILAAFGILWRRSRAEPTLSGDKSPVLLAFEKMAVRIRKRRSRKRKNAEPGRRQVHRNMMILYPDRRIERREEIYYVRKLRNALLLTFLGTALAFVYVLSVLANPLIEEGGSIAREGYGGQDRDVSLSVRMENQDKTQKATDDYSFTVGSQLYSKSELNRLADDLKKELPKRILGSNLSLEHVESRLQLPSSVEGYPFRISWESSSYALVDSDGSVYTDELRPGDTQQAVLTAILTYRDEEKFEQEIPVTVQAPKLDSQQQLRHDILAALKASEQKTARTRRFLLPSKVDGMDLTWSEKADTTGWTVLLLFAGASAAVWFGTDRRLHRQMEERKQQMEIDYPGILNRMVLYLGAGMSVRNSFFRLGNDYRIKREKGGERHYAYDEILLVCRELESGHSETEAYTGFGLRCGAGQYTKLCTLLIRNLRKGNSVLLSVLQAEAQEATAHRRNLAKELGEKAGTKMLFPMVTMLAITMILIIVPAYFGFSV